MIDLKPYYQVKLTLLRCKTYFLNNPPKTEDEKYAYDIIQKAYWINEKKIEMQETGNVIAETFFIILNMDIFF